MGPANALSYLPDPNITLNNANITLLPDNIFICAINMTLSDKVASSSSTDPLVLDTVCNIHANSSLFPHSEPANWHFEHPFLYFKNHLYLPPDSHQDVVSAVHLSLAASHAGFFHTYSMLSWDYWWPGMSTFICRFIAGCTICQQMKVNTHPTVPVLSPLPSACTHLFQQLSVNLITDLPLSNGFNSLRVMVDHSLSKGVILTPCNKTINAKGVANLFFKNVFIHFGLHDHLISDCRLQFASAFAEELAHILGYNLKLSTAYHPQTDRGTEWVNQEIKLISRYSAKDSLTDGQISFQWHNLHITLPLTHLPKSWTNIPPCS